MFGSLLGKRRGEEERRSSRLDCLITLNQYERPLTAGEHISLISLLKSINKNYSVSCCWQITFTGIAAFRAVY